MRILLLAAWLFSLGAAAAEPGTNLTVAYPDPACGPKPAKPAEPASRNVSGEITLYNQKVEQYNEQAVKYGTCVGTYVENANNDIERIRVKAQALLDAARKP